MAISNIVNTGEPFTPITVASNEAIQSLASMYQNGKLVVSNLKITNSLDATGATITSGAITTSGDVTINGQLNTTGTITVDKRNSDFGPNIQILSPKKEDAYIQWIKNDGKTRTCYDKGTYRAHEGDGDFKIDLGKGNFTVNGNNMYKGQNRLIYEGLPLGIQSSRTGFLSDQGGWKGVPTAADNWETMYLRIPSFVK